MWFLWARHVVGQEQEPLMQNLDKRLGVNHLGDQDIDGLMLKYILNRILCFVDCTSLYNLVNKANLVDDFS
jgi:hypothetical protein